jgi:hypothetical protein
MMTEYQAHFSYYSENSGRFETQLIKIRAENLLEARGQAWEGWDRGDCAAFASCVKLSGVTWEASPLNLEDYFNALAARYKCAMNEIREVELRNDEIERAPENAARHNSDLYSLSGGLDCVYFTARDIGKPLGMAPPNVHEELQYALKFVDILDQRREHETAQALYEVIERSKKWDNSMEFMLRGLFRDGNIYLNGDYVDFAEQFGRNGVCPTVADRTDFAHTYIYRWRHAPKVTEIARLPMFAQDNVVKNSQSIPFEYRTLVLRRERLNEPFRMPENLLWTPSETDDAIPGDPDVVFSAENVITGETEEWRRWDFCGVLRPEFCENIDFDKLRAEYAAEHEDKEREGWGDEDEM